MIIFVVFIILGLIFGLIHGILVHKLGAYLKKYHPLNWQGLSPKEFMGITKENVESRNYFAEMRFVLSDDDLSDPKISKKKGRIKLFLFLAIICWLCFFLSLFII